MAQLVKNLPAMWETWVRSLGWEDPLEKGKATHSSILAWKIPWTVWSMGLQRVKHNRATELNSASSVVCSAEGFFSVLFFPFTFQQSSMPTLQSALSPFFLPFPRLLLIAAHVRGRGCSIILVCFPGGLDGNESACNTGDLGSIPGLGISPGEGHGNSL